MIVTDNPNLLPEPIGEMESYMASLIEMKEHNDRFNLIVTVVLYSIGVAGEICEPMDIHDQHSVMANITDTMVWFRSVDVPCDYTIEDVMVYVKTKILYVTCENIRLYRRRREEKLPVFRYEREKALSINYYAEHKRVTSKLQKKLRQPKALILIQLALMEAI